MIKLIIDNSFVEIRGANKECEFEIWDKLSFEIENFNSPYIQKKHLFNRKTKLAYTGLLPYILEILDFRAEDYKIIDNRVEWEKNADFKLVEYIDKEKNIKLEARPYQQKIIDSCTNREIIQACTGAGKTFMMAAIVAKFNVKPVALFADKITLCEQLKQEFEKFLGVKVGIVGGGRNEREDITVFSAQSATPEDVQDAKLLMVDECLEYNQLVLMEDGTYEKIGNLVENNIDKKVMSYNHIKNILEPRKISSYSKLKLGDKKLMKITTVGNHTIKCTNNHKFWVNNLNQYIEADKLTKDMFLKLKNLSNKKIIKIEYINDVEYVYDIGVEDNHNFFCNNILVHNCQHLPSRTFVDICNSAKNAYYRIGVSATPWRDAGDDLLIDAVINKRDLDKKVTASELIKLGFLTPCNIHTIKINDRYKGKNYHKVYKDAIVYNNKRNNIIAKLAIKLKDRRHEKVLVLIKIVEHGEILLDLISKHTEIKTFTQKIINKRGNEVEVEVKNVEFLSGKDKFEKRQAVIAAAREGKVDILIGSTIADEGLDVPTLSALILAGAGKSSTRAFQRVGRVLRLSKNKTTANVFDFDDATDMFHRQYNARMKMYKTEPEWKLKNFNLNLLRK